MSNLPWRSSLAFRLALTLSGFITLFWLLSTCIVLFWDFENTRDGLLERLEVLTASQAGQQSAELHAVVHDVKTLFDTWRALPEAVGLEKTHYLAAHYIVTDTSSVDPLERVNQALAFVEAYGSGGLGNFIDTFVVLENGIAISNANGPHSDTPHHLSRLLSLRTLPVRHGLIWSEPYRNDEGLWCLLIAELDQKTGVIVGGTVQLSLPLGLDKLATIDKGAIVWVGADATPITPMPALAPPGLLSLLPDCHEPYSSIVDGVRVTCMRVEPTGWRLVLLYPAHQITNRALVAQPKHLLVALVVLISLVGLIYWVLQRNLGRTLARFVRTITPQAVVSEQQHLPQGGGDELGQIARAYNRLLDTLLAQYTQLESKVAERTAELDEARCRAERANANKSEQLTNISHEIRTPLNGIVGAMTLLGSTNCDANQHDLVDTALKCSGHLLEIINNLLDFSRIESGQMVVTPSALDPLELIDQAMLTVQLPALNKQLTLRCQVAATFPAQLHTDGLRLRQILINLLGNAVKFTPSGSVTLLAWSGQGHIYFSVRDSGPGIPLAKYKEVFTAFRQLDDHIAGSGLGLPIARSLAQLLGGELYLVPVASGACFQLVLPQMAVGAQRVVEPVERQPVIAPLRLHKQLLAWGYVPEVGANSRLEAPELAYLPGRLRQHLVTDGVTQLVGDVLPISPWSLQVLVVDDVDTNRDIVGRMLRQQGHRVCEVSCGEDALAQGRAHVFDLVLMDVRMPGLSGADTVALWRDDASGMLDPECLIVALTANAQPGERERLLGIGFNEYLTKPVTPVMLARAVEFTADQQLARGIELEPNLGCKQAILGRDPSLLLRLGVDLRHYHGCLGDAMAGGDDDACQTLLHTLKGLAGQAGLEQLRELITHWEEALQRGQTMPEEAWRQVGCVIERELAALV